MSHHDIVVSCRLGLPAWRLANALSLYAAASRLRWQIQVSFGLVLSILAVGVSSVRADQTPGESPSSTTQSATGAQLKKQEGRAAEGSKGQVAPQVEPDSATRAYLLEKVYAYKGWAFPFPAFADSLTQDVGHWRTKLARYGFGFSTQQAIIAMANVLDTPRKIPSSVPVPPCTARNLNYNCAGGHTYVGQTPMVAPSGFLMLTYDLSRWGIPDGQLAMGLNYRLSTDQQFGARTLRLQGLSYYQTLFDKRLEFKIGIFPTLFEFMGTYVGGNTVNPFGPNASLPTSLGMTGGAGTPTVRLAVHVTKELYATAALQRSTPVRGPTGNRGFDETYANPTGFEITSDVPGTKLLSINEVGYKTQLGGFTPFTWLRADLLYNTSTFTDYSKLLTDPANATKKGSYGLAVLLDRQVWQQAPGSPRSAYRGIYVGGNYMYGQKEVVPFSHYFQAQSYWIGPFNSRSTDMISVVYVHNVVSKPLHDLAAAGAQRTQLYPIRQANSITASYSAHITHGFHVTVGLGYTDNPSIQYFKGQGSALSLLTSIFWVL